jgi:cell division protein FtsA
MSQDNHIGIIEISDIYIKCVIFKIDKNITEILSTSITPSDGIHNDVVKNLTKASSVIRSCISAAEKKAKVSLKKINVIFEQPDFLCTKFSKHKKIDGAKIHKDDIEFLVKESKKQLVRNDKNHSIIHIFNHNYIVDQKTFIEEPINIYADLLTHEMTFITAPKNNLRNINQVFSDCDIKIERLISRTFALGANILNKNELETGSILIDLGFEKISLGIFKNLALVHSITFPLGANHITKDISKVCSLDLEESENIKSNINFSFFENQNIFDENNYLKRNYFINSNFRKISKDLVLNVIKARLDEIVNMLKKQLIVPGFNINSRKNFILAGVGSNLLNIEKYFENLLGPSVTNITSVINGKENNLQKDFASCLGAFKIIKDGWETEAIAKKNVVNLEKMGFFSKIFGANS